MHILLNLVWLSGTLVFESGPKVSRNIEVISSTQTPFSEEGGLKLLSGNLGRSVIKTSALKPEQFFIEAPAIVFEISGIFTRCI